MGPKWAYHGGSIKMKVLTMKIADILQRLSWIGPLLVRITIGVVFMQSGWGKLHHLDKVIAYFTELGIPAPQIQAPFVAGVEFFCGSAVLLGVLTRLASIPLIGIMIVAILTAKRDQISDLSEIFGIAEFLYIILLISLIFSGSGLLSLDTFLFKKKHEM